MITVQSQVRNTIIDATGTCSNTKEQHKQLQGHDVLSTKSTKLLLQRIRTVNTRIILLAIGGYVLWNIEHLKHFAFTFPLVWMPFLLVPTYYEDLLNLYYSYDPKQGNPYKQPHAVSIEYNTKCYLIVALYVYSVATSILLRSSLFYRITESVSDPSNRADTEHNAIPSTPSSNRFLTIWNGTNTTMISSADEMNPASAVPIIRNHHVTWYTGWYYAFGILCMYHLLEGVYYEFFLRPDHYHDKIQNKDIISVSKLKQRPTGWYIPLYAVAMLYFRDGIPSNMQYFNEIIQTISIGWLILHIMHFVFEYCTLQLTNTLPATLTHTNFGMNRWSKILQSDNEIDRSTTNQGETVKITTSSTLNVQHKNIWRIYGNEYDATAFVPLHPGGVESIMLAADREDATALFQMYHPFNIGKAKSVLEKYRINTIPNNVSKSKEQSKPSVVHDTTISPHHENDVFYDILCQRVAKVLREEYNMDPTKDRGMSYTRLILYLSILTGWIVSLYWHCHGYVIGTIFVAFFWNNLGAHIGHDGGHFAVSRIPWINNISLWGISGIVNPIYWQHQHTYGHHSFTNDVYNDPDLNHFKGFFKVTKNEIDNHHQVISDPSKRAQPWFLLIIYSLVTAALTVWFPSRFVLERSIHGTSSEWTDRSRPGRTFLFFLHWVGFLFITVYIPIIVQPTFVRGLLSFLAYAIVSGLYFSITTQVGHISEETLDEEHLKQSRSERHPIFHKSSSSSSSFAVQQCEAGIDINPLNPIYFFFFGGMGVQIEHHLFPSLNHCHLWKIHPIVEQTCKEYGIQFKKKDNWSIAMQDLFHHLKNCT